MSLVFLDTVGLVAIWDHDDQWHQDAAITLASLVAERARFVTTTFILGECGNAMSRTRMRQSVVDLRGRLEADAVRDRGQSAVRDRGQSVHISSP